MRRAAGASYDDLETAAFSGGGILEQEVRRPVRRNNTALERHAEPLQRLGRVHHGFPIGFGPHNQPDERSGSYISLPAWRPRQHRGLNLRLKTSAVPRSRLRLRTRSRFEAKGYSESL